MILLLSGGLDSLATWRLLGLCKAVNFDMGTKPQPREQQALDWAQFHFGARYTKRSLPMGDYEERNGFVPFRNALLILAAAQMDPHVVIAQIAEWAPDKNLRCYRRLERLVNVPGQLADFNGGLKITAPFAALAKGELIAMYCDTFGLAETKELLSRTWSCYGDGDQHCGQCGGCVQRWNAEAHFAAVSGLPPQDVMGVYAHEPEFVPTPSKDKARWLRDNGYQGLRQLSARRRQNDSAKALHDAHVPDLPPVLPFRQRADQVK